MSSMTYDEKPLVWLHGEIKTPPFSQQARLEAGYLLGRLQCGVLLSLPQSRPMPAIGNRCHELRIADQEHNWRVIYRIDADAVLILEIFSKKTQATPKDVIVNCQRRIRRYEQAIGERQ